MGNKTHKLQIPLDPKVFKELQKVALSEDVPVTIVVRAAIKAHLEVYKIRRELADDPKDFVPNTQTA